MNYYSQSSGLIALDGVVVGQGYSGYGDGLNNPALQDSADIGPLPQGNYTFGTALAEGPGHTGEFVIPLTPDAATRARIIASGRNPDSFFSHGDTALDIKLRLELASRGCLIAGRLIREAMAASTDRGLTVTA